MDNKELLLAMGYFECDGWLCNPNLDGQPVFKLNSSAFGCENVSLAELSAHMTASAFNAGTRWQETNMKKELAGRLRREADALEGIVNDANNDDDD